jgi:L-lactate dehydrogenase complex protein LldE
VRVSLLVTCVVDLVEPDVGEAAVRVLRAAGCEVRVNVAQTCCGQPAWNAGFAHDAARVARTTLAALEADLAAGAEAVVVPAGSCAAMVKVFWPELFDATGDRAAAERARAVGERTHELTAFLAPRADRLPALRAAVDSRVAYHRSCHLLRELRVVDEPEALLTLVQGCDVVAWDGADRCCGFGGTFSVKLPETSVAMADDKLAALAAARPDVVVSADTSCLLHIRGRAEAVGQPITTRHVAQVLDDALTRQGAAPS